MTCFVAEPPGHPSNIGRFLPHAIMPVMLINMQT